MKLTPIAPVRTSTCPGPGEGASVWVYCRTSGEPAWVAWVTYMPPTYAAVAAGFSRWGFSPLGSAGGVQPAGLSRLHPVARQPLQPGGRPLVHRLAVLGGQADAVWAMRVHVQFHRRARAAPCGGGVQRVLHGHALVLGGVPAEQRRYVGVRAVLQAQLHRQAFRRVLAAQAEA